MNENEVKTIKPVISDTITDKNTDSSNNLQQQTTAIQPATELPTTGVQDNSPVQFFQGSLLLLLLITGFGIYQKCRNYHFSDCH